MKKDFDRLMAERNLDAIVVIGRPNTSRDIYYLTGPVGVGACQIVKKRGEAPVFIVGSMERDEARKSGLEVKTFDDFRLMQIWRDTADRLEGRVKGFEKIFDDLGIRGEVGFYGTGELGYQHGLIDALAGTGRVKVRVEPFDTIFSELRLTKDKDEVDTMIEVNRKAQEVMGAIRDFLGSCRDRGGRIIEPDGADVTIGSVKERIDRETRARGMILPEPVIFSQGRDSAVPHSRGEDAAPLVTGKTIVFDYVPQEASGGYHADITRTWCLGHIPDGVQAVYDHVLEIQLLVLDALETGRLCSDYDKMTNEFFDSKGHPTPMKGTAATEGYVHSLGHGLGLEIHERPWLTMFAKTEERLAPGHVFTVEPGIYYPDREIGVRLEDDVVIRDDGSILNLTSFAKDLLVPLSG